MKEDKQYKPTIRAKMLRRVKLAIKCFIRENDSQDLYYRGRRAIYFIDELCHGLGKDIGIKRQEHVLLMRHKLNTVINPNEFLDNEMVDMITRICIIIICIIIITLATICRLTSCV